MKEVYAVDEDGKIFRVRVRPIMKLKKANAALALLSILLMLVHVGYSVFEYLTMYYNPFLTKVLAWPFMVTVCLHAVLGMLTVFLQADGTRMDLYPEQNLRTILQRVSAALIFPLVILHINTFMLMQGCAERGQKGFIILLIFGEILFFAVIITHVVTSITKAFITMGWLASRETQKKLDKVFYILGAIVFAAAVYSVVKGQAMMFLS